MNPLRIDAIGGLLAGYKQTTPVTGESTVEKTGFLFVQSFQAGSIAAKEGEAGAYTVTLEGGLGQTVFFSDRPDRFVGIAPTAKFLEGLGFDAENPPNAALVISNDAGETDIAVVELTNPGYDEASATATYDVQFLENFADFGGTFHFDPVDLAEVASSFGAAHLLIDDCADKPLFCRRMDDNNIYYDVNDPALGWHGMCWQWDTWVCLPCEESDLHGVCVLEHPGWCGGMTAYDCKVTT